MLHPRQFWQKPGALLAAAKAIEHPPNHIVDRQIGRGRNTGGRQFLEQDRGVDATEPAAAELLADIDCGKAQRRRAPQGLDREFLPLVPTRGMGQPFFASEIARGFLKRLLRFRQRELHRPNIAGAGRAATGTRAPPDAPRRTRSIRRELAEML